MKELTTTPEERGQADTKSTKGKDLRALPEGWQWTTLEECVDILDYRRIPINSDEREQRIAGKEQSELYPYYGATGLVGWIDDFIFDEEIVLLGEDGAPFLETKNKAYIVRGKCWVNNHAHVLRAKNGVTTNLFLMHYLNIFDYHGYVTGTTRLKLNQGRMREFPIILPPLPEQERIVARLEELLSDLEAGVAALVRARAGVRRYKASVLKAACEGKLFDVGAHGMRPSVQAGRTPSAPKGVGGLPEGWRWVKMDEIADTIGGVTKGRNLTGKATIMLPYLRVANVQRGRLDLDVMKEIEIFASEVGKYRLQDGDVVLTEGGDWDKLGRSAIWRNQIPDCIHQNHIFRARVKSSDVLPEWLMYYTNSEPGQYYFKEAAKQTTNLASINLTQLRACPIPLPPLEEQRHIVADAERRLESARAVESAAEVGLKRARRLQQAVLRSAFEGRLGLHKI
jgi:type I restriction enzyme S subunit